MVKQLKKEKYWNSGILNQFLNLDSTHSSLCVFIRLFLREKIHEIHLNQGFIRLHISKVVEMK